MARPKKVVPNELDEEIQDIVDEIEEEEVKKKSKKEKVLTPEQEQSKWDKEAKERARPFGFRYEVSLAKKEEPNCYVGFFDCDTYREAEQVCIDKAYCEDRECILWDCDVRRIVFRCKPPTPESPVSAESGLDSVNKPAAPDQRRTKSVKRK